MDSDVIFFEKSHRYETADGKAVPSTSEIISPLSMLVYNGVDKATLEAAAQKGSAIHSFTVDLDNGKEIVVDDDLGGYISGYIKAVKDHNIHWRKDLTEKPMGYNNEFAGTIDRFGDVDGKKTLVDIKTPSTMPNKKLVVYEAQLNLYRKILEAHGETVEQMFILHLKKDGEYSLIEVPIDDTLADNCLYIWKRMNEKKRRKK